MSKLYISFLRGVLIASLSNCLGMDLSYSRDLLSTTNVIDVSVKPRPNSAPSEYEFSKENLALFERVAKTMVSYEKQIKYELRNSERYINIVSRNKAIVDFSTYCHEHQQKGNDIHPIFEKIYELIIKDTCDRLHLLQVLDLATSKCREETIIWNSKQ